MLSDMPLVISMSIDNQHQVLKPSATVTQKRHDYICRVGISSSNTSGLGRIHSNPKYH